MRPVFLVPVLAAAATASAGAAPVCSARATGPAPIVVELYTSEGCSSCPPADRWLSTLKARPDVLALAFHVNYWNHLGWTDRFATPEATARQRVLAQRAGQTSVYTPQVVADGRDWRRWPQLPAAATVPSAVNVTLVRDGDTITADVAAAAGAPSKLEGYWAVLEDGHVSRVRAGENAGETLRHDHVVRLYQPVGAWAAAAPAHWQLGVTRGVPEQPRRVAFVVTDPATGRPLQAAVLGC